MRSRIDASHRVVGLLVLGTAVLASCAPSDVEEAADVAPPSITRLEVISTESPTFDGMAFGEVGQYEKIIARAYAEVDPSDRRNALITDIDLAPKNARGMVEYSTDVHIIKPIDLSRGNAGILFGVANRGSKGIETFNGEGGNNPTTAEDAGTGFLMRHGYTLVWAGWQPESLLEPGGDRVLAALPTARNPDGSSIVGPTVVEQIFDGSSSDTFEVPFYAAASLDQSQARMLVHNHTRFVGGPLVERVEVPASVWSWVDDRTVRIDRAHPFLEPYDAGASFEFVYPAKDPVVLALGFATTRDVIEFLRHDTSEANPLRGAIQYALATGWSQTGRYIREFIYWGFNEDLSGRRVFEGMLPRLTGAHGIPLNERFGDTDATGRSYQRELTAKIEFPFTYDVRTDPISGQTDGIFARCMETDTCPNVMQLDNGNEAFLKAMSLVTTDGQGQDVELPPNVRVYYLGSIQHGPSGSPSQTGTCQQLSNPNNPEPYIRALFVALDAWATRGELPPESRYPKVSDGTLVPSLPQEGMGFPRIPGVRYTGWHTTVAVKDRTSLPNMWVAGKEYTVLVPKTDVDGNDLAGVRSIEVQVPVATYTGWALRRAPYAEGEDCALTGQYIAFPATRAQREATGDPRLSVEERYSDHADYVSKVEQATSAMVQDRLLLQEDADAIRAAAAASDIGTR